MFEAIPSAILLDIRPEYAAFAKQAAPYLQGIELTPVKIVEQLWEAMFDKDVWDEMLLDAVCDVSKQLQKNQPTMTDIEPVVYDFAEVIYKRIEDHNLHGERGYLPYNMEVVQNGLLVLKVDNQMDKVQQECIDQDEVEAA